MDGWMDTQLQQQIHMDNVEKLQSPVPNPSPWQEIPETSKGIILGVRQRLQIWQVWGIFNCLNKHINKICSLAGAFFSPPGLCSTMDERNCNHSAAKIVAGAPCEGFAHEPGSNLHPLSLRGLIIFCAVLRRSVKTSKMQ